MNFSQNHPSVAIVGPLRVYPRLRIRVDSDAPVDLNEFSLSFGL
jgi:hypothetical protein